MNNLGIALGAYTDETNRQREQQRADAADQRQQQQFDLQMQEAERVKGIRSQRESMVQKLKGYDAALQNWQDPNNFAQLQQAAKEYKLGELGRVGNTVGLFKGSEQGVPQFEPFDPNTYRAQIQSMLLDQMMYADADQLPAYLQGQQKAAYERQKDDRTFAQGDRRLAQGDSQLEISGRQVDNTYQLGLGNLAVAQQNAATSRMQYSQPKFVTDGSGQVLALSPDGRSVLGAYGSPRPAGGGGVAGQFNLTDEQANVLNKALQARRVAAQLKQTNPEASRIYDMEAVRLVETLPAKVQLEVTNGLGAVATDAVGDWDRPVKVKRATDQGEIEMTVPLRVADPEGYARYLREQQAARLMPEPGSSFFGDRAVAEPQNAAAEQPALNVDEQREMRRLKAIAELEELRRRTGNPEAGRGLPAIVPSVTPPSINFNDLQGRTNGPLNNYGAGR